MILRSFFISARQDEDLATRASAEGMTKAALVRALLERASPDFRAEESKPDDLRLRSFHLPPDLDKALTDAATDKGAKKGQLVRRALQEGLLDELGRSASATDLSVPVPRPNGIDADAVAAVPAAAGTVSPVVTVAKG